MDNTLKSPTILSLCPGMLGLERGVERTIGRINTVAYVEIEAFVIENLVRQMESGVLAPAPVWSNVKTFSRVADFFRGKIDLITGGYPCQPFSVAGQRKGTEDHRHLWPYIGQGGGIIDTIKPAACFFENVPGHLTLGFREVKSDLEQLGYRVEAGIFSAEEVGAPHQRKRLFILAILGDTQGKYERSRSGKDEQIESGRSGAGWSKGAGRDLFFSDVPYPTINKLANSGGPRNEAWFSESEQWQERNSEITNDHSDRAAGVGQADSCCEGLERLRKRNAEKRRKEQNGHIGGGGDLWPARPGEDQYEWEAPRTESGMGFTVNGHNFREDLLRMAGNGVVEATAGLALETLLNKHLKKQAA